MEPTYDWQPISVSERKLYEVKTYIARGFANLWKINSKFSFYLFHKNVYWYSIDRRVAFISIWILILLNLCNIALNGKLISGLLKRHHPKCQSFRRILENGNWVWYAAAEHPRERGKSLLIKLMDQDLLQVGTKVLESGLKTILFSWNKKQSKKKLPKFWKC